MATLNTEVLEWAVTRSGLSDEQIVKAFPKYHAWLDGSWKPTVKQLRDFASKTHVSVSELFASDPARLCVANRGLPYDRRCARARPEPRALRYRRCHDGPTGMDEELISCTMDMPPSTSLDLMPVRRWSRRREANS